MVTKDGYILEMHRIPKKGAQPVLLMHGILDTSATWVLMGPKSGLGECEEAKQRLKSNLFFYCSARLHALRSGLRRVDGQLAWQSLLKEPHQLEQ